MANSHLPAGSPLRQLYNGILGIRDWVASSGRSTGEIYDPNGRTERSSGHSDSIPFSLEP